MAVVNINRNQFEEMVHSGNAVLVEFSAPWCVYCRRLAPALESVAEEYKDTLVFTAINIDDEPELAEAEAIEVVPTLLIYHSGQVLGSIVAPESRAQLGAEGEQELIGKGIHYCAACDGMFYRNKTVVIAGGGNTAAADALILSRICKKVIVVHRRDTLKATKIYHEPLMKTENVEFLWDSEIVALLHNEKLTGIQIRNVKTGEESTLACDGVFVSVGRKPSTELVKEQVEVDPAGYILADESTRTNIPGVFAVGDVRTKALRQVVTAVADGATAVHYAEEFLAGGM